VIMTSNLGADRIQQDTLRDEPFERVRADVMEIVRRSFRPEFINRIDEIIVFQALTDKEITEITRLLVDRLDRRVRAQGIEIEFTDEAIELLAHEGFDPEFGARPLRRTIQRLVENELSKMVLSGAADEGDRVRVDALEGELHFEVERRVTEAAPDEAAGRAGAVSS
jgi:ATP-dependent Clp protease ATP-binding subunit ClpC